MNEDFRELQKQLHESQAKYTEVLMAIAGSCIALSVHRTTGAVPAWSMVLLAAAVLSWACSIIAGIKNRRVFQCMLHANAALLKVLAGQEPERGTHPAYMKAASDGILSALEEHNSRASSSAAWQFNWLLIGAALFLIWHVIEMFTNATSMPKAL